MTEKPIASAILEEAQGAHGASCKILQLMETPGDDPIEAIVTLLQSIQSTQQRILTRLDIIERRIVSGE